MKYEEAVATAKNLKAVYKEDTFILYSQQAFASCYGDKLLDCCGWRIRRLWNTRLSPANGVGVGAMWVEPPPMGDEELRQLASWPVHDTRGLECSQRKDRLRDKLNELIPNYKVLSLNRTFLWWY